MPSNVSIFEEIEFRHRNLIINVVTVSALSKHLSSGFCNWTWPKFAEVIQVGLHAAEPEVIPANPLIDDSGDLVKTRCMTTLHSRVEPTADEKITVYQFMEECRKQQRSIEVWMRKNWFGEDNQSLKAALLSGT